VHLPLRSRKINIHRPPRLLWPPKAPTPTRQPLLRLDSPEDVQPWRIHPTRCLSTMLLQGGESGGAKGANGGKLAILADDKKPSIKPSTSATVASRPATRSSLSKSSNGLKDVDGDAVMSEAPSSRPIKSLRSTATGILAGKPSNIPRQSIGPGSTKNAGLKRSLRTSTAGIALSSVSSTATSTEPTAATTTTTTTTKNAGLRLKREIQQVIVDDVKAEQRSLPLSQEDLNPPLEEGGRRRSKRLRASDAQDVSSSHEHSAHPSTSNSLLGLDDERIASVVGSIIDVSDDEEDRMSKELDSDDEDEVEGIPTRVDCKDAGWENLDAGDEEDPLMVAEYVKEIHHYMKELEVGQIFQSLSSGAHPTNTAVLSYIS